MRQLDRTMNDSIYLNLSLVIAAFIGKIVIMFSSRAPNTRGKSTSILTILRTSLTFWRRTLWWSLSDDLLGSVNQPPSVWAPMNLCRERCSKAAAERAGTLQGVLNDRALVVGSVADLDELANAQG